MEKFHRRVVVFFLLLMFCMTATIFCLIWQHQKMLSMGYELAKLYRRREELISKRRRLNIILERLRSPARIEKMAQKMGLIRPLNPKILCIEVGGKDAYR